MNLLSTHVSLIIYFYQDQSKFELCDVIRTILRSFPKSNFDEDPWLPLLQKGKFKNVRIVLSIVNVA